MKVKINSKKMMTWAKIKLKKGIRERKHQNEDQVRDRNWFVGRCACMR